MVNALGTVAKALTGFVVAAYSLYQTAIIETSPGGVGVTSNEWVNIIVTGLLAGFAVWAIPNTPTTPK